MTSNGAALCLAVGSVGTPPVATGGRPDSARTRFWPVCRFSLMNRVGRGSPPRVRRPTSPTSPDSFFRIRLRKSSAPHDQFRRSALRDLTTLHSARRCNTSDAESVCRSFVVLGTGANRLGPSADVTFKAVPARSSADGAGHRQQGGLPPSSKVSTFHRHGDLESSFDGPYFGEIPETQGHGFDVIWDPWWRRGQPWTGHSPDYLDHSHHGVPGGSAGSRARSNGEGTFSAFLFQVNHRQWVHLHGKQLVPHHYPLVGYFSSCSN